MLNDSHQPVLPEAPNEVEPVPQVAAFKNFEWKMAAMTAVDGALIEPSLQHITAAGVADADLSVRPEGAVAIQSELSASFRDLLMRQVIQAQEAERRRIAQDIHDETEQLLGNAIFRLDMCMMQTHDLPDSAKSDLEKVRVILIESVHGLQNISQSLRPSLLDELGLEASLAWLFRTTGLKERLNLRWKVTGSIRRISSEVEVALFRIVQEACNNVLKHAQAKNLNVVVKIDRDRAVLAVTDDGVGFDANTASSQSQAGRDSIPMGLSGMKERAELVKGRFRLRSVPQKGTRITVMIPLHFQVEELPK